ncbi:MAG: response regulator [Proteobacteria bacterium]|nr:response regulator [Pseudomonadota bacterium]
MTTTQHTILIVDDEESIRFSLARLFNKLDIPVISAAGCDDALEMLSTRKEPVTLIISDQRMPGINGAEFLEKSRAVCPDAIRFLLTGFSDMDAVVDAVNKGQIHRYLKKPWDNDELISQVKESLKQYELINENKRLLKLTAKHTRQLFKFGIIMKQKVQEHGKAIAKLKTSLKSLDKELKDNHLNTVNAFLSLVESLMPSTEGHGSRVSLLCREMAAKMGVSEKDLADIELASLAHDIGKLKLAEGMWQKSKDQFTEEDMDMYKKHPEEGQNMVLFSPRLENAGKIIRHHHEHFDGSGWPDGIGDTDIPLGAKIIAVADAYDRIKKMNETVSPGEGEDGSPSVSEYINAQAGIKFDPEVTRVFSEVTANK